MRNLLLLFPPYFLILNLISGCVLLPVEGQDSEPPLAPTTTRTPLHPTPLPSQTHTISPSPTATTTGTPTPGPTATVSPTATETPFQCSAAAGRMESHRLYSDLSPLPWEFRIYLPPCYNEQADRKYPTLYLIHGSNNSDQQWDNLGVDEMADALITSQEIPPLIIIMPRDRVWKEPADDPFDEALIQYVVPWVDANYRTQTGRDYRAIGGLSRGAAWAIRIGLAHWERFGAIGGHSFFVFRSDTANVRGWLEGIPPSLIPSLYLDIGENDYLVEAATWFESLLNRMSIPHEFYQFPGRHDDAYWRANLARYLRWYTKNW